MPSGWTPSFRKIYFVISFFKDKNMFISNIILFIIFVLYYFTF